MQRQAQEFEAERQSVEAQRAVVAASGQLRVRLLETRRFSNIVTTRAHRCVESHS
jgi:hypothetical protein